ncbi:MAG: hypothetical protein GF375_01650 [Candidatus Omnitrophica bacterium]|nr:hypothetical protein [Candidatus Omnitrophota bacterium]
MPMFVGQQGEGITNSLATGNPQAEDRKDTERIARLVAMARQGQGQLSMTEKKLLKKIQRERVKHAKARADWQRKAAMHRQKISMLLDQLEQVRTPQPQGRFQQAAAQPRVVGKGNRKAIARAKMTRRVAPPPEEPPARVSPWGGRKAPAGTQTAQRVAPAGRAPGSRKYASKEEARQRMERVKELRKRYWQKQKSRELAQKVIPGQPARQATRRAPLREIQSIPWLRR